MDNEYMSGSQLCRYLHISTRKMKYFMDHHIIPHENTGQSTHKYRIRREDAEAFKWRIDNVPGFLDELAGVFSSRKPERRQKIDYEAFKAFLIEEWEDQPDLITVKAISALSGLTAQRIAEMIRDGRLNGIKLSGKQYCLKEEIIDYAASKACSNRDPGVKYRALIMRFYKQL